MVFMNFNDLDNYFKNNKFKWLVTGAAGFIGSNITEKLLEFGQEVIAIDNFATGYKENIDILKNKFTNQEVEFLFKEIDVVDYEACSEITKGVDFVLHQAAIGSVPRSIKEPIYSNLNNVNGFLNIIETSRLNSVKRIIFASSSSVYGDNEILPKKENNIGRQLSPYAVTKYVNEIYSEVFNYTYEMESIGLRYFNVFGPRQDPDGSYAAVIPKWIKLMIDNKPIEIYGDGKTSRDFCYIDNAVQANILAALTDEISNFEEGPVFNVAVGGRISLNKLYREIKSSLHDNGINYDIQPVYKDFRSGDVRHSQADIELTKNYIKYEPKDSFESGIKKTVEWYLKNHELKD